MRWLPPLLALLVILLASPAALAQGAEDTVNEILGDEPADPTSSAEDTLGGAQDEVVPDETPAADTSLLDDLLSGAAGLVNDVGDAIASGITGAADAIGGAFMAVITAVADAAVWTFKATGTGLGHIGSAVLWSITGIGTIMITVVRGIGTGASDLITGTGAFIDWTARGLAGLRPDGMSETAWAGTVATTATGASVAANLGAANWLKRAGWLSALGGAPLFSRIAKDDILEHPLRAEIFDTIKSNPGIHISALARQVDAGWGTTIHHLRKLQEKELVAVRMVNNQKCYFQNGGDVSRSAWTQLPELKNKTANNIAQYVLHNPLSPVTTISDALGLSPSLVSHHVRKLERAGLVEKIRDGRFVKLAVTERARAEVFGEVAPTAVPASVPGVAA